MEVTKPIRGDEITQWVECEENIQGDQPLRLL